MSVGDATQQLLCTLNNVCTSCNGNVLLLLLYLCGELVVSVRISSTFMVRLKSCFVAALLKRLKTAFVLKIGSSVFRWTGPRIPSDQEMVPTWTKNRAFTSNAAAVSLTRRFPIITVHRLERYLKLKKQNPQTWLQSVWTGFFFFFLQRSRL